MADLLPFAVFRREDTKLMGRFETRKEAVYFCKVEQTLPLPDYEWDDEFEIREYDQTGKVKYD